MLTFSQIVDRTVKRCREQGYAVSRSNVAIVARTILVNDGVELSTLSPESKILTPVVYAALDELRRLAAES